MRFSGVVRLLNPTRVPHLGQSPSAAILSKGQKATLAERFSGGRWLAGNLYALELDADVRWQIRDRRAERENAAWLRRNLVAV